MATYYVGSGGNDSNDGLSWANRKLTLNGAEDIPVSAGDTVICAPGVYRESLTVDVSGSSGSPITYVADVTGENTDGVGGVVRVTTSSDDQSNGSTHCVTGSSKDYRTFRGFSFVPNGNRGLYLTSCTNWIIEDCVIQGHSSAVYVDGASQAAITVRRCVAWIGQGTGGYGVYFTHTSDVSNTGHVVENCIFLGGAVGSNVYVINIGGITVTHCSFLGGTNGVYVQQVPAAGQTITVNNCVMTGLSTALFSASSGYIVEDYNNLYGNNAARTNVSTGGNSVAYPLNLHSPVLLSGVVFPAPILGHPSQWTATRRLAGTSMSSADLYGRTRPATDSKKSWGAVQYVEPIRETTTIDGASGASLKLDDAGRTQFIVPVDAVSTTFSVAVYREADYTGTLPQMVIKQPGQSDTTVTDTGDAATWNTLSTTLVPAAAPPYVVLELVSLNSATSGSYSVYFDTVQVT